MKSQADKNKSLPTIEEVIGEYVELKRVGKVFKGRCPFHASDGEGRRRSLVVWPETQTFHCFVDRCKANSSKLGHRQGILDFLELIEEIPPQLPPEPAQKTSEPESRQEKQAPRTLPLPFIESEPLFTQVSYSMLELYQLCPFRFKREYIENRNTGKSTFNRRLGLSIHNALDKFYDLPVEERTLDNLYCLLDESWQTLHRNEEDTYWHSKAREWLESLYHSEETLTNSVALEESFKFCVGDFWISGRVDRIDKTPDGRYEVIDYKVLRKDPGDSQEAEDSLQSVCLYFGTQSLMGAFPNKITYLHVDTGVRASFAPRESDMRKRLSLIKKLVREMGAAVQFPAVRNRFCSACKLYGRCAATLDESLTS